MNPAESIDQLHVRLLDDGRIGIVDLRATGTVVAELPPRDALLFASRLHDAVRRAGKSPAPARRPQPYPTG